MQMIQDILDSMCSLSVTTWRSEILRLLEDRFFVFAFENESFGGIAELLSVLKTVVYEWEEPLSQDQRQFFVRSVLPLYRTDAAGDGAEVHEGLSTVLWTCILCDDSLIPVVWSALLRYFPKTNATKAKLFFQECERLLEDDTTTPEHLANPEVERLLLQVLRFTTRPLCNVELAKTAVSAISTSGAVSVVTSASACLSIATGRILCNGGVAADRVQTFPQPHANNAL